MISINRFRITFRDNIIVMRIELNGLTMYQTSTFKKELQTKFSKERISED